MPRGMRIGFARNVRVSADSFTLDQTGLSASLFYNRVLQADSGAISLAGFPASFISATVPPVPAPVSTGPYRSYLIHPKGDNGPADDPEGDGVAGMSPANFNKHTQQSWENLYGDYLDKNGVKYNGSNANTMVPWHTYVFPKFPTGSALGWVTIDFTDLTSHWLSTGKNKGCSLQVSSVSNDNAFIRISGTRTTNYPRLVVTTSTGTFEFIADMAGFFTGGTGGTDARQSMKLAKNSRVFLQCEYLPDVTGVFISAQLKLYITDQDNVYPLTVKFFETDAPELRLGSGGKPQILGVADRVGEIALQGNPSPIPTVYAAGDFKMRNIWNAQYDNPGINDTVAASTRYPGNLFTSCTTTAKQKSKTEFYVDKVHAPGTTEYRGILFPDQVPLDVGFGEIHYAVPQSRPDYNDPLRPIRADCPKEMYARMYILFENDFKSGIRDQFGFKMGMGWDAQFGVGGAYNGWTNLAGSGQEPSWGVKFKIFPFPSTGPDPLTVGAIEGDIWWQYDVITGAGSRAKKLKLINGVWTDWARNLYLPNGATPGVVQWGYEGHSLRMHSGGFMGEFGTKYPNLIALNSAPSHLGNPPGTPPLTKGTYDIVFDGGVFGTEQVFRIGTGVHEKDAHCFELGKWYCLESYLKINSIDLSVVDPHGNGRARNDGILRYWIDGAMVGEITDLALMNHPDLGIEGTWFIMFHGGTKGVPDPITGIYPGMPDTTMHYRLNNYVCSTEYIGPNPVRHYPGGVNPPSEPPANGTGDLTSFVQKIGLATASPNSWIDTGINAKGCWAVKSMVDGGRYATKEEVEVNTADKGNFSAIASDSLVNSNGAAWFPTLKRFYWRGGGHGGWMGNEIYWMDMPSMTMGRLVNPSPLAREGNTTPSGYGWKTLDGTPKSYHTYDGIIAVESLNCFFTVLSGGLWPEGGFPNSADLWKFHIPTKTWTMVRANVMAPVVYDVSVRAFWVPSQQKIALGKPNYWRWYDPFTDTLGPILGGQSTLSNGTSVATPTGIYSFGGGKDAQGNPTVSCFFIAYANIGISAPVSMNSAVIPRIRGHSKWVDVGHQYNSYLWDSNRNMVISWSGSYTSETTTNGLDKGRQVYGLDFVNDRLYEFYSPTPGPFARSQALGSFTKWQHIPDYDFYIGCNNRMIGDTGNSNGWLVFKPGTPTLLA